MIDTANSRSIAVLRTRLPCTDRRSLSQAWFSALHLAEDGRPTVHAARRSGDRAARIGGARASAVTLAAERCGASYKAPRAGAASREPGRSDDFIPKRLRDLTRPAPRGAFERARSYPPFSTSLTVGIDGTRIKLLLRREGPTLHVIALCAERNVELVRRALACADAHLRRSGESIRASVRTLGEVTA